jgi:hypothetical protein
MAETCCEEKTVYTYSVYTGIVSTEYIRKSERVTVIVREGMNKIVTDD